MRFNKLASRRFVAWAVEVSLVVTSAVVPLSIGFVAQSYSSTDKVPLNPVLATTEEAIARTLALPWRQQSTRQVAPLTNLFWCGALVVPLVWTGWQLYLLGKTGQTSPKRWLRLRVVTASGTPPGIMRVLWREGGGRWGWTVGVAYIIWRYSGAFPDGVILLGLTGLMLLVDSAYSFFHPQQRTLHDRLAGTYVLNAVRKYDKPDSEAYQSATVQQSPPIKLELQSSWADPDPESSMHRSREAVTTIILTSLPRWGKGNLWQWMRQHPGATLLIVAIAAMTSVLGTFVGTQIYIQSQANRRVFKQQDNEVYLALVKQLKSNSGNGIEERRAALLAMAELDDSRAVSFLINWLAQEKTVELIDTLEQAIVSTGPKALPDLQRQNQSLRSDLEVLRRRGSVKEQQLIALRLRATQRAIAKILNLYNGQIHKVDFSRTNLSSNASSLGNFSLILDKADLSGMNFKGALLANASLRGSRFYGAGEDERLGTFDDWIANLSGAELKEANLTDAILTQVELTRANLIRATLNRANLSEANLTGANLSSTQLVDANLQKAVLENASLTGADLGNANFSQSNLTGARLGKASAIGAQFQLAQMKQSDWQAADLTRANFTGANLQNADLSSAKLVEANLSQAKLKNANLQNADLSTANLQGADLDGADFQGVIFAPVTQSNSDQFIQAPPFGASVAQIKNVNFTNVKNLDAKQIDFICAQGGIYPKCRIN